MIPTLSVGGSGGRELGVILVPMKVVASSSFKLNGVLELYDIS